MPELLKQYVFCMLIQEWNVELNIFGVCEIYESPEFIYGQSCIFFATMLLQARRTT